MNALEAKGYTRKPRPGAASMPFIPTGGNVDGSAGPPMKRRRNTPDVADEFSSEPGKRLRKYNFVVPKNTDKIDSRDTKKRIFQQGRIPK